MTSKNCPHRNSIAVDIDGAGEDFRFCNDCGENFWTTMNGSPNTVALQILALIESSIEDTRVPDAIAEYADRRADKPVNKNDVAVLEKQLGVPMRIRREYGRTHIAWAAGTGPNPWRDERSILLGYSETGVRWPHGHQLRQTEVAYFGARDDRNAARHMLLREHQTLRGVIGDETPSIDDESLIYQAAKAIVQLREARATLQKLVDYGQPLHVVRSAIEKLGEQG